MYVDMYDVGCMYVYVDMYVCMMYVCVWRYVWCMYVYVDMYDVWCMYVYVDMSDVCMYVCMIMYVYVDIYDVWCMYVYVDMYVCMYVLQMECWNYEFNL